jgi:putative ATP-dependent endonuclease of OLD family
MKDLKAYVRQNQLVISTKAEWNQESRNAEVKQFGLRNVIRAFAPWFEADKNGARVAELREIYQNFLALYPDLMQATTKDAMRNALRDYEESHPESCELIESSILLPLSLRHRAKRV